MGVPGTGAKKLVRQARDAWDEGLAAITVTSPCLGTDGTGRPGR